MISYFFQQLYKKNLFSYFWNYNIILHHFLMKDKNCIDVLSQNYDISDFQ